LKITLTNHRPTLILIYRKMLLDMHANIKRILRAIEAIPLHLTLDIVRFDDALGESWALPYQACKQWRVGYFTTRTDSTLVSFYVIRNCVSKWYIVLTDNDRYSKKCCRL
jgi:hypothetical protein